VQKASIKQLTAYHREKQIKVNYFIIRLKWKGNMIYAILLMHNLATYADETVLNEQGKIDYHVFKPVLFEFPTYEYFKTGEKAVDCAVR
jgi:hypothetical protein